MLLGDFQIRYIMAAPPSKTFSPQEDCHENTARQVSNLFARSDRNRRSTAESSRRTRESNLYHADRRPTRNYFRPGSPPVGATCKHSNQGYTERLQDSFDDE